MKIIISPAKKMKVDLDSFDYNNLPIFLNQTKTILKWLKGLSLSELKLLWNCSDSIAEENFERIQNMDLKKNLTPAIFAYEGIQYKYMTPIVFEQKMLDYIENNLRILSGFYGMLKPFDGVTPYRLEMQAKTKINGVSGLYDFWKDDLYKTVKDDSNIIINLASKEYSKCIEQYLLPSDIFVTCVFGELSNGKVVQKGTYAKIARGEMVRFMAENNVNTLEAVKKFNVSGYKYNKKLSTEKEFVFLSNA